MRNLILSALAPSELERVMPALEPVELAAREVLVDVDTPIRDVVFPETAVVSLVAVMTDRVGVDVAAIGFEGVVGVSLALGVDRIPFQAFVQVPGRGHRLRGDRFLELARGPLREQVLRYTQWFFTMAAQGGACNVLHSVGERCARWLAATADRLGDARFELTQELLAQMLGVRRASVNEVARRLQDIGIIQYSRGRVTILDRARLEAEACACYRIVRAEIARLCGPGTKLDADSPLEGLSFSRGGVKAVGPPGDGDGGRDGTATPEYE